jgi:small subunit ribosomal protein S25
LIYSEALSKEAVAKEKKDNEANFGIGCLRHCICELPGQVPCPSVVPLPDHMRGKIKYAVN